MAFKYAERVQESSTSTGTGDLVLAGAPDSTYQTFSTAFSGGDTTDVAIFGTGGFESCRATYNSGANSITRGSRYASSDGGAAVNFGAGTKTIIVSLPGALSDFIGTITSAGKAILDDADAAAQYATLGEPRSIPGGRFTLTTNTAVMVATVAATGTLYYTPHSHNVIWLYDGAKWVRRAFSETSVALSGGTASRMHDVFGYDNAGTLALELLAWTSDTVRATALARQNGVLVKTGDATRHWLGSVYLDASKQSQHKYGTAAAGGGTAQFDVWNAYNRVPLRTITQNTTANWTYNSTTPREPNASTTMRVYQARGLSDDHVTLDYRCSGSGGASGDYCVAVSFNGSTTPLGQVGYGSFGTNSSIQQAMYCGDPGIGRYFANPLEMQVTTITGATYFGVVGTRNVNGLLVSTTY